MKIEIEAAIVKERKAKEAAKLAAQQAEKNAQQAEKNAQQAEKKAQQAVKAKEKAQQEQLLSEDRAIIAMIQNTNLPDKSIATILNLEISRVAALRKNT